MSHPVFFYSYTPPSFETYYTFLLLCKWLLKKQLRLSVKRNLHHTSFSQCELLQLFAVGMCDVVH